MIRIKEEIKKQRENFWNHCLFHPTDAIEDAWGKRILDRMSADGSVQTVRLYAMLEDIVIKGENDELTYDFRVNDLRLDYLVEKGFDIVLAYGGMPECIAKDKNAKTNVSKNKTRYKGKLWNTSIPEDEQLWEDICYEYTKHIIERYGIDVVSKWHCQCLNEPDISWFFLSNLPTTEENTQIRLKEYCKLYRGFEKGIRRASERMCIGGPALANRHEFLGGFLDYVRENDLQLDFISVHIYGTTPIRLNDGTDKLTVNNNIQKHKALAEVIKKHGFEDTELIVDEWGASSHGFYNIEDAPELIFRDTEVYSAYYTKLIYEYIEQNLPVSKLLICLSGQHEMTADFTGFQNFFTLNFFAKPIYNAYIMSSKLKINMLDTQIDDPNIFVIPTKDESEEYAVMFTYCSENFEEDIPEKYEEIVFDKNMEGKHVKVYCIDKETTNPYRLYTKKNCEDLSKDDIKELRLEGQMKPIKDYIAGENHKLTLKLTPNATYLITII